MPKDKISFSDWLQYEYRAVKEAWSGIGSATLYRAIGGAVLGAFGQRWAGFRNSHETLVLLLVMVGGALAVFLIEFLIRFIIAPAKMAKEQAEKFEEEKRLHLQTKQALAFAKNAKAEKVVEQLTELGKTLLRRVSSIKGIDSVKYSPDKDDETWTAIHETIAYIVLNLTQEAGQVFDDGIMDIHGYAIPHSGLGSTMYEDRQREVLAKLDRRFRNLKWIIDEIDKYLKPMPPVVQK